MAEFAGKPKAVADTIFGNCTATIPLKFAFDGGDTGHTVVIAPTRNGMQERVSLKKRLLRKWMSK